MVRPYLALYIVAQILKRSSIVLFRSYYCSRRPWSVNSPRIFSFRILRQPFRTQNIAFWRPSSEIAKITPSSRTRIILIEIVILCGLLSNYVEKANLIRISPSLYKENSPIFHKFNKTNTLGMKFHLQYRGNSSIRDLLVIRISVKRSPSIHMTEFSAHIIRDITSFYFLDYYECFSTGQHPDYDIFANFSETSST